MACGKYQTNKINLKEVDVYSSIRLDESEVMPNAKMIENYWKLENIGIMNDPAESDDEIAMKLFTKSVN